MSQSQRQNLGKVSLKQAYNLLEFQMYLGCEVVRNRVLGTHRFTQMGEWPLGFCFHKTWACGVVRGKPWLAGIRSRSRDGGHNEVQYSGNKRAPNGAPRVNFGTQILRAQILCSLGRFWRNGPFCTSGSWYPH